MTWDCKFLAIDPLFTYVQYNNPSTRRPEEGVGGTFLIPECLLANASNDFYPLLTKHPMRKSTRIYQTIIATIRACHQFAPS
jgi:hypothetical protein